MAPLDFSSVIAYLLPGFVAFYSLIFVSTRASELIAQALSKDESSTGVILILTLFSLASGVVVSAFRGLVLDDLQFKTGVTKPTLDFSRLAEEGKLNAFNEAIANTYRFAQFYGNMAVSVVLVLIGRLMQDEKPQEDLRIYVVFCLTIVVLFLSHRKQLEQTYSTLGKILS